MWGGVGASVGVDTQQSLTYGVLVSESLCACSSVRMIVRMIGVPAVVRVRVFLGSRLRSIVCTTVGST